MRGESHAISGAAAWLAVSSSSVAALDLGLTPATGTVIFGGTIVTAGAAMLSDIDHASGTIAYSLPDVKIGSLTLIPSPTRAMAKFFGWLSGGHRHGTHSILGILFFGLLTWAADQVRIGVYGRELPVLSALITVLLMAYATKALGINTALSRAAKGTRSRGVIGGIIGGVLGSWVGPWVLALTGSGLITWYGNTSTWSWLWISVLVGCFIHCVGDSLTPQKVPWLWPWNPAPPKFLRRGPIRHLTAKFWGNNGYMGLPVLGTTSTGKNRRKITREAVLAGLMSAYVIYLLVYEFIELYGEVNVLP